MSASVQPSSNLSDTTMPTAQVILPPDAPPEIVKKERGIPKYVIILIVVYTVLLYGFFGYLIYSKNSHKQVTTTESTASPVLPQLVDVPQAATESGHGFNLTQSAKLEVIDLSVPSSEWYKPNRTPTYVDVVIDKNLVDAVSAYTYKHIMFIAPKHWYGEMQADADSYIVKLYPKQAFDDTGQSIHAYIYATGSLVGVQAAYAFFPWVREHKENFGIKEGELDVADVATASAVSPHLVTYHDNHVNLELYGAIYENIEQHLEDRRWTIQRMEVRMFGEERAFAKQLINTFIEQNQLKNQ